KFCEIEVQNGSACLDPSNRGRCEVHGGHNVWVVKCESALLCNGLDRHPVGAHPKRVRELNPTPWIDGHGEIEPAFEGQGRSWGGCRGRGWRGHDWAVTV